MSMNWNKFAAEVHQNAVDHGWWEPKPSFAQIVVMCHSELSEAVEEYRAGNRIRPGQPTPMAYYSGGGYVASAPTKCCTKPEGVAVEMADCILRILDALAEAGVDIDAKFRYTVAPKDLIENVAQGHAYLSTAYIMRNSQHRRDDNLLMCMAVILEWARLNNVDMESVLRAKHEYNKTRPFRHGGKKL